MFKGLFKNMQNTYISGPANLRTEVRNWKMKYDLKEFQRATRFGYVDSLGFPTRQRMIPRTMIAPLIIHALSGPQLLTQFRKTKFICRKKRAEDKIPATIKITPSVRMIRIVWFERRCSKGWNCIIEQTMHNCHLTTCWIAHSSDKIC